MQNHAALSEFLSSEKYLNFCMLAVFNLIEKHMVLYYYRLSLLCFLDITYAKSLAFTSGLDSSGVYLPCLSAVKSAYNYKNVFFP